MSSPNGQLVKRERMLRHAQRDVPNILKARFSPTAIWTTESEIVPTERTTTSTAEETTRAVTTPVAVTHTTSSVVTSTLVTSSKSITPTSTSSTPATTLTSSALTTSSSSSSSSTPKTTSSTPTTTSTFLVHTTTAPTMALSTTPNTTAFVTMTVSSSSHAVASAAGSALDSAASSTSSATAASGVSTAGVIGIAAAGIAGAAVIAGIVMFFLRRWNRNADEFNPVDFRRQSIVLRDDNSSLYRGNSSNRGPRPPTMFERHNQTFATFSASPMPPANAYHQAAPYGSPSPFSDFAASQPSPSFSPGMYIPNTAAPPAPSGQYQNTPSFFSPSFQSPAGSPVTVNSYGGAAFDAQGQLVRGPSNAGASMLSRGNSVAHPHYPVDESDYANLSRASVTPYQAAQYEAISKRLNIENPSGNTLQQISEADGMDESHRASKQSLAAYAMSAKPSIDVSPFDDQHESYGKGTESTHIDEDLMKPSRPSSEFHPMNSFTHPEDPSPRVTSKPPSLPEIHMEHSTFSPVSYSFPMTPSPRKASFDIQSGRASPKVDLPPLSPVSTSPQRAQFVDGNELSAHNGRETPVEIGFVADGVSTPNATVPTPAQAHTQAAKRPDTLYDVEDAYGGF